MLWALFFALSKLHLGSMQLDVFFACVHHVIACSFHTVTLLGITLAVAPFNFVKRCKKNIRAMERSYVFLLIVLTKNDHLEFIISLVK